MTVTAEATVATMAMVVVGKGTPVVEATAG
jgi:hypothetical protein